MNTKTMKHPLRSAVCTEGRRMAGARALWLATGMKREQMGKPIIAIANSFNYSNHVSTTWCSVLVSHPHVQQHVNWCSTDTSPLTAK